VITISKQCEYCDRLIKGEPTIKVLRGKTHTFCTEFCFRLFFYHVPKISYLDLQKMYKSRCVDLYPQDFSKLLD